MNTETKKTIETSLLLIAFTCLFFGSILLASILSGHELLSMLPDFSWDMMNSWDDIFKK